MESVAFDAQNDTVTCDHSIAENIYTDMRALVPLILAVLAVMAAGEDDGSFQLINIKSILAELGMTMDQLEQMAFPSDGVEESRRTGHGNGQGASQQRMKELNDILHVETPSKSQEGPTAPPSVDPSAPVLNLSTDNSNVIGPGPLDSSLPPVLDLSSNGATNLRDASTLPLPDNQTPTGRPPGESEATPQHQLTPKKHPPPQPNHKHSTSQVNVPAPQPKTSPSSSHIALTS